MVKESEGNKKTAELRLALGNEKSPAVTHCYLR